jgi:hypothetical protein
MSLLNLNLPIIGGTNANEDPKIRTALSDIQTVVNALDNANIASGADINGSKLDDATVSAAKLASNSVETAKIVNDAVTNDKIADDAVNTAQIADNAVTGAKIASLPDSTTTTLTNDGSVTAGTITARKYTDGLVRLTGAVTVPWEGYFSSVTVHSETWLALEIGVLAENYRPVANELLIGSAFEAGSYGTTQPAFVIIETDGTVSVRENDFLPTSSNPTRWVLDGVTFHAA